MHRWRSVRGWLVVAAVAAAAQAAACLWVVTARGRLDALALASVDAGQYLTLARNLADRSLFSRDSQPPYLPDTWRTPGYPLLLAGWCRLVGTVPARLVLMQQALAALNVVLLYGLARRWCSQRAAMAAALLWALEPFRLYYSLWLLSTTWLTTFVLAGLACWSWWLQDRTSVLRAALVGASTGAAVLIWPIALLLPVLAGAGVWAVGSATTSRARLTAGCLAAAALLLGPWLARNYALTGRVGLCHQGGAVLTYFKALEVVLWDRGQSRQRYSPAVRIAIWRQFDQRVRRQWQRQYGPLSPRQRRELVWPNITCGRVRTVNPFDLSRVAYRVGLSILAERPVATLTCGLLRMGSVLTFPLSVAICPPTEPTAGPLQRLLPATGASLRRALAGGLGTLYVLLVVAAGWGGWRAGQRQGWLLPLSCWLPVLALLIVVTPQTDPRFRVPMVPLLLLAAALAGSGRPADDAQERSPEQ